MTNTIKINGESLRRMVKSATTVTVKSSPVSMCYSTLLRAENNRLTVCANNLITAYKAVTDCTASGDFEIVLDDDTVKKILNIKGGELTLTHESGKMTVNVSDGKKKMSLACYEPKENDFNFDSFTSGKVGFFQDWKTLFVIPAAELLPTIKTLEKFTTKDDLRPILCGYHFDGTDLVSLDGYRMCVKHLQSAEKRTTDEWKFTADAMLANIGNIFEKSDNIHISLADKGISTMYATQSGDIDVQYVVRNYDGDYHNWKSSIPTSYTSVISVTAGDITEIAKEYKSYISEKDKRPIIFGTYNGKLYGYIETNDVRVSQEIVADNLVNAEIFAGYNIEFTRDCFGVFGKKEKVQCRYKDDKSPLLVSNGEYDCLLLPINLGKYSNNEDSRKKYENKLKNFKETSAA